MDISQFSPQNGLVLGILKKNNMESKDICFLVSYDEKYENISKISVHNNIRRYCKLHGYTLWVDKQETKYDDRVSQWQKIKVALNILENNSFKWLFFMDSDCLIMDTKKKLEEFLDEQFSFFFQDNDVIMRLKQKGCKHGLVGGSKVNHYGQSSHGIFKSREDWYKNTFGLEKAFIEKWRNYL